MTYTEIVKNKYTAKAWPISLIWQIKADNVFVWLISFVFLWAITVTIMIHILLQIPINMVSDGCRLHHSFWLTYHVVYGQTSSWNLLLRFRNAQILASSQGQAIFHQVISLWFAFPSFRFKIKEFKQYSLWPILRNTIWLDMVFKKEKMIFEIYGLNDCKLFH